MKITRKQVNPLMKWQFAIGTTSFVPQPSNTYNAQSKHYLIVDIDTTNEDKLIETRLYILNTLYMRKLKEGEIPIFSYSTKHGYHIYTNYVSSFRRIISILRKVPNVDRKWLNIAENRGYLFLADKEPVILEWPVQRMFIHYVKKRRT